MFTPGQLLGIFGLAGGLGIAALGGSVGLAIFLFKARPCWRLYQVTLGSVLASLAGLLLLVLGTGNGIVLLWGGLPVLAGGLGLFANAAWGRQQLRSLPGDLDEDARQQAVERIGRRIWFPLMGLVALGIACVILPLSGLIL